MTTVRNVQTAKKKTSSREKKVKTPVVDMNEQAPVTSLNLLTNAGVQPYPLNNKEEYMNALQLEHFKKILIAWDEQIQQEMERVASNIYNDPTNFPDPTDRASQEEKFSLELRNSDRERRLVKKIKLSLKMIEDNEFGYCESCGIEIGIRRLEARPTATLCIDCKSVAEYREKQIAKGR